MWLSYHVPGSVSCGYTLDDWQIKKACHSSLFFCLFIGGILALGRDRGCSRKWSWNWALTRVVLRQRATSGQKNIYNILFFLQTRRHGPLHCKHQPLTNAFLALQKRGFFSPFYAILCRVVTLLKFISNLRKFEKGSCSIILLR